MTALDHGNETFSKNKHFKKEQTFLLFQWTKFQSLFQITFVSKYKVCFKEQTFQRTNRFYLNKVCSICIVNKLFI